jgi:hypothetical protein
VALGQLPGIARSGPATLPDDLRPAAWTAANRFRPVRMMPGARRR